jgi:2-dehydropantoate 2-reductase
LYSGTILTETQKEWLRTLGELTDFRTLEDSLFRKAALNACINPVTALFRIKNGKIAEDRERTKREKERGEGEKETRKVPKKESGSMQRESGRGEGPWVWVERLAKETREVMERERPQLDMRGLEEEVAKLTHQTRDNTNSMLADVMNGRETEIDYINGAISKLGRKHGVETPWHNEIIDRIKHLDRNE